MKPKGLWLKGAPINAKSPKINRQESRWLAIGYRLLISFSTDRSATLLLPCTARGDTVAVPPSPLRYGIPLPPLVTRLASSQGDLGL